MVAGLRPEGHCHLAQQRPRSPGCRRPKPLLPQMTSPSADGCVLAMALWRGSGGGGPGPWLGGQRTGTHNPVHPAPRAGSRGRRLWAARAGAQESGCRWTRWPETRTRGRVTRPSPGEGGSDQQSDRRPGREPGGARGTEGGRASPVSSLLQPCAPQRPLQAPGPAPSLGPVQTVEAAEPRCPSSDSPTGAQAPPAGIQGRPGPRVGLAAPGGLSPADALVSGGQGGWGTPASGARPPQSRSVSGGRGPAGTGAGRGGAACVGKLRVTAILSPAPLLSWLRKRSRKRRVHGRRRDSGKAPTPRPWHCARSRSSGASGRGQLAATPHPGCGAASRGDLAAGSGSLGARGRAPRGTGEGSETPTPEAPGEASPPPSSGGRQALAPRP